MRIAQISITGLFGVFDHVIPLNLDDRITIIHAPNGYGKTIVLKMLHSLMNCQSNEFINTELMMIPYKKFKVEFDTGDYVEVVKEIQEGVSSPTLAVDFGESPQSINYCRSFDEVKKAVSVYLIESQRLLIFPVEKKDLLNPGFPDERLRRIYDSPGLRYIQQLDRKAKKMIIYLYRLFENVLMN